MPPNGTLPTRLQTHPQKPSKNGVFFGVKPRTVTARTHHWSPRDLIIEHLITADMPDDQPLPPFMDDNAIWCVVRRFPDQKTLWRRISLQTTRSSYRRGSVAWKPFQRQGPNE